MSPFLFVTNIRLSTRVIIFLFASVICSQAQFQRASNDPNVKSPSARLFHERHHNPGKVLSVVDTAFTVLGRWAWGPCRAVERTGQYALIGQGFVYQVFDVSNPSSPRMLYDTTFDSWVKDIKVKDSLLIIAFSDKFVVYQSTTLFPLQEIGRSPSISGFPVDLTISDSLLFLLADNAGVLAYNISDPTRPYFRRQYSFVGESALAIATQSPYVYYGTDGPGISMIILKYRTDSTFLQKAYDVGGNAVSLHVRDTLLFVGNTYGELRIYDIRDPWSPLFIDSINLGSQVLSIATNEHNVYCSTQNLGVVVLNISNSLHPVLVSTSRFHIPEVQSKLACSDSLLFESSYGSGFLLYSVDLHPKKIPSLYIWIA